MLGSPSSLLACAAALASVCACTETVDKSIRIARVAPQADPSCGAPEDGRTMIVRALGDFAASESSAQSIELGQDASFQVDRFPSNTELLEVEVRGFGGAIRTIGKTAAFDIASLGKDETLSVFMAPPLGTCPTGPRQIVRQSPLLAAAGQGVLIVGGEDSAGAPVSLAEYYDPAEGAFVTLPDTLYGASSPLGLRGASLTTLAAGNVALVGGSSTAYQVFDRGALAFGAPAFYREARGHHAAVALGDGRLFLAGGCSQLMAAGCAESSALTTSSILDLSSGELEPGPALQRERIGGTAYVESEASVLLVGGRDPAGSPLGVAERLFLDGRASEIVEGVMGASAQAESGSIWAGMPLPGEPASDQLSLVAPGAKEARTGLRGALSDQGGTIVSLEDGSLLLVGVAGAQRLRSLDGSAEDLGIVELQGRQGAQALRLVDGSVLILAGEGASAGSDAFIFRPSLVGPKSSSASASFSSLALSEGLSARDPSVLRFSGEDGDHLELEVGDQEAEYLLIAGPRVRDFELQAGVSLEGGSLLLFFGWQSASNHWKVNLRSGSEARLFRVENGVSSLRGGCSAKALDGGALSRESRSHEVQTLVEVGRLRVLLDGLEVLSCELDESSQGRVGVGIEGDTGQTLRLDIISLGR